MSTDRSDMFDGDAGFSLIEVIVSVMIFAVIAMGVAMAAATSLKLTGDTRSSETATHLAASEIDSARALEDPFKVFDATRTETLEGVDYTVHRDVQWVQSSSDSEGCHSTSGAAAGSLQYKRVNVTVTWQGAVGDESEVHADTILAPKSRLNDPRYGTVLISVVGADGTGRSGVQVNFTGSGRIGTPPSSTDSDGCSYALFVPPGRWTLSIARAGYLDTSQNASPTVQLDVSAGGASSASFQYDAQAGYSLAYPTNTVVPTNLDVAFSNTYGTVTRGNRPTSVQLHPFSSGYSLLAGGYAAPTSSTAGCVSPDPEAWPSGSVNGIDLQAGVRQAASTAAPGSSTTAPVGMGVIDIATAATSMRIVRASAPTTGDPGCAAATIARYTYSLPQAGPALLAVPYGSWELQEYVNGSWAAVGTDRYSVPTNAAGDIDAGTVTTVDPRRVAG